MDGSEVPDDTWLIIQMPAGVFVWNLGQIADADRDDIILAARASVGFPANDSWATSPDLSLSITVGRPPDGLLSRAMTGVVEELAEVPVAEYRARYAAYVHQAAVEDALPVLPEFDPAMPADSQADAGAAAAQTTIHFPDVSHYQAGLSLEPYPAAIAKATQGTGYTDPSYASFKAQASALGIPFAAYHWVDTGDIDTQAAHAFSVVGGVPLMWDAEAAGATVPRLLALTTAYRKLGGIVSLVYLPAWWWHDLGAPDLRPLSEAGLSLVSSNYPSGGYSDNGPGWLPYGGMTPVQWQYTETPLDMNAFRGTAADYRALLYGAQPPEEDMTPQQALDFEALVYRVEAMINNRPTVVGGPTAGEVNQLHNKLEQIAAGGGGEVVLSPAGLAEVKASAHDGAASAINGATIHPA